MRRNQSPGRRGAVKIRRCRTAAAAATMFLVNRVRIPGSFRLIRKYWLKGCIFIFVSVIVIMLVYSLKYQMEMTRLNDIIKEQTHRVEKMISLTASKSHMNDTWRKADVKNARIFSAYLDIRPEVVLNEVPNAGYENLWALIRIIAILSVETDGSELTCYYRYSAEPPMNKTVIMKAPAVAVRIIAKIENFGMSYSAFFVLCRLVTTEDGRLPSEVTFSSNSKATHQDLNRIDFVDVHYSVNRESSKPDRFMAVCVPSLHHDYDKHINLVEFIEFYRMMGVNSFTFYNTSVTSKVSRVLAYYENLGVATVLQWQLPSIYVFERTLRYNGIFAMLNECLYRNSMVGGYKYVVNVDLDEFIIPRKHKNFRDMMDYLDPDPQNSKYAAFIFRNMFFYLMHEDNPLPQIPPDSPKLLLHTKTTRLKRINPAHDRSKYIARGQTVVEMGNHRLWETKKISLIFRTEFEESVVDPDVAGSHHYRNCEVNELVCWLRETTPDTAAHKFTNALATRVAENLKKIF